MLHDQIPHVTAFFKGGKNPKPPAPPAPPTPSQAAENFAQSEINARNRRARGFSGSIIGGYADVQDQRQDSQSLLKRLLGQ